jgi:glycosyltransferase involved in cell wall biosynthesis
MKSKRKSIYILYPDGIIAYSPTVLNLYDALAPLFDVTIFTYEPDKFFGDQKPGNRNIHYLKKSGWLKRMLFATLYHVGIGLFKTPRIGRYRFKRQLNLLWHLKLTKKSDAIIAIDLISLWTAQKFHNHIHFVSLEIYEDDPLKSKINLEKIRSVIFQSEIRFRFYFPNENVPVFYIPNAPVFRELEMPIHKKGFIYNGTAIPEFGIFQCVEYIARFAGESLTIKGAVPTPIQSELETKYRSLLDANTLTIDKTYVDSSELTAYLSQFRIGFCFYDLSFEKINTFNYLTAPSGKMFAYLAAGIPVIGNKIIGLSILEESNSGVLIESITPEQINEAVQRIESNYSWYSSNALAIARHYSFDKKVAPFIDFVLEDLGTN